MEQSPSSKADSYLDSQQVLRHLWNAKFHYRVHKSPPFILVLIQMNPVHKFPPYFPKILSNIIFPSTPLYPEWSLPFRTSVGLNARYSGNQTKWLTHVVILWVVTSYTDLVGYQDLNLHRRGNLRYHIIMTSLFVIVPFLSELYSTWQ